jgi:hypothetical protein
MAADADFSDHRVCGELLCSAHSDTVFIAETRTEPGIVDILRSALLLPKGLRERLTARSLKLS